MRTPGTEVAERAERIHDTLCEDGARIVVAQAQPDDAVHAVHDPAAAEQAIDDNVLMIRAACEGLIFGCANRSELRALGPRLGDAIRIGFERAREELNGVASRHGDQALRDVDALCGDLIAFAESSQRRVILLSEYGITRVSHAVHINRELRRAGWLSVREELGRELLDPGASDAFAVSDHQLAHVYVKRPALVGEVAERLRALDGVECVNLP